MVCWKLFDPATLCRYPHFQFYPRIVLTQVLLDIVDEDWLADSLSDDGSTVLSARIGAELPYLDIEIPVKHKLHSDEVDDTSEIDP